MEKIQIRRALISVSNKEGIIGFAQFLHNKGVEIVATGGTAKKLQGAGIPLSSLESITKNPEAFGGRMKTISFPMTSSILYRRDVEEDVATAEAMGIQPMDLVVCNLYPFAEAVQKNAGDAELIEEIDIGGPTMVRAAAKNFRFVAICTDPSQYADVMAEMEKEENALSLETRQKLAVLAFQQTSRYELMIAQELSKRFLKEDFSVLSLEKGVELRYGENPHQDAKFYRLPQFSQGPSIASAPILQGKALSYNNILDADAAHRSASDAYLAVEKNKAVVAIVKHLNPCGLAAATTSLQALELAWAGDPVSAFGGILCFTRPLDIACVEWLGDKFIEVLVAPSIEPEAMALLAKKKNLRVMICAPKETAGEKMLRSFSGGILIQNEDEGLDQELRCVTQKKFPDEMRALAHFGIMAGKHLRSNAIALVRKNKDGSLQLVGAGMGQPNRVDSLRALAGPRAKEKGKLGEMLLVSDAFFPFADIVESAHELGIQSIVQPGGSIRDNEVIEACDKFGIAMAFTGVRHFRH